MNEMCVLLIERGEDIKSKIEAFVLEKGWKRTYISGGIGSVQEVTLTVPKTATLPPELERVFVKEPAEMVSFVGEILPREEMDPMMARMFREDSPLFVHIHSAVAVAGGAQVLGGGFQGGKAFRSLKVYLQPEPGC